MWVRSQDKTKLLKGYGFHIFKDIVELGVCEYGIYCTCSDFNVRQFLGKYSTKEKALKVLDEIQFKIDDNYGDFSYDGYGDNHFIGSIYTTYNKVYQMPQDDEVN